VCDVFQTGEDVWRLDFLTDVRDDFGVHAFAFEYRLCAFEVYVGRFSFGYLVRRDDVVPAFHVGESSARVKWVGETNPRYGTETETIRRVGSSSFLC
jgi:hypothetical protein